MGCMRIEQRVNQIDIPSFFIREPKISNNCRISISWLDNEIIINKFPTSEPWRTQQRSYHEQAGRQKLRIRGVVL
jgi:hypothetical protein